MRNIENTIKSTKNIKWIIFFILLLIFITLKLFGKIEYYPKGNEYFYSNLSFINGINISRWYGQLKNADPNITKILFNKFYFPAVFAIKYSTFVFTGLIKLFFL